MFFKLSIGNLKEGNYSLNLFSEEKNLKSGFYSVQKKKKKFNYYFYININIIFFNLSYSIYIYIYIFFLVFFVEVSFYICKFGLKKNSLKLRKFKI